MNGKRAVKIAVACLALSPLCSPVAAQILPDPTRPPPGFVDPADVRAGGAGGPGSSGEANAGSAPERAGLVLQSVLLPRHGTPVAVISGKYLPLGARIEQWELKSVNEHEAVLMHGRERRVLKLTPQARKTMVQAAPSASPKKPVRVRPAKNAPVKESELKR